MTPAGTQYKPEGRRKYTLGYLNCFTPKPKKQKTIPFIQLKTGRVIQS